MIGDVLILLALVIIISKELSKRFLARSNRWLWFHPLKVTICWYRRHMEKSGCQRPKRAWNSLPNIFRRPNKPMQSHQTPLTYEAPASSNVPFLYQYTLIYIYIVVMAFVGRSAYFTFVPEVGIV